MSTETKTVRPLSLNDLLEREAKTADRQLSVRTGVRAGGGGGTLGKFAKYR